MSWAGKQHPLEVVIEWLAPIPLALALGWAGSRLGLGFGWSSALGLGALVAGLAAFRLGGSGSSLALRRFEPVEFEPVASDELLLEEGDAVLELHDRLEDPHPDSRVVRLFERQEPTPGELVDRIVDFLSEGRRQERPGRSGAETNPLPDASIALHEALANIRASLR